MTSSSSSSDVLDQPKTTRTGLAKPQAFEFGKNWKRFLTRLDDARIDEAEASLKDLLCDGLGQRHPLQGSRFLDAGSGSGLFSLAAFRLGANVVSFDVDSDSVACTRYLQQKFGQDEDRWQVKEGSLLDREFLHSLGSFDVIYCWGVAHHTGNMWSAIENLIRLVAPEGSIVLAIYNDQLYVSRAWSIIKHVYQRLPQPLRPIYAAVIGLFEFSKRLIVTLAASLIRLLSLRNPLTPLTNWITESQSRGMHGWYDLLDWVGGYPFEVAKPEEVFRFCRDRGFVLQEMSTSSGHGCNEFVFRKHSAKTTNEC